MKSSFFCFLLFLCFLMNHSLRAIGPGESPDLNECSAWKLLLYEIRLKGQQKKIREKLARCFQEKENYKKQLGRCYQEQEIYKKRIEELNLSLQECLKKSEQNNVE